MPNDPIGANRWKARLHNLQTWLLRFRVMLVGVLIWAVVVFYAYFYLAGVYQPSLRTTPPNLPAQVKTLFSQQTAERTSRFFATLLRRGDTGLETELSDRTKSLDDVIAVLNNRADIWLLVMGTAMALSIFTALGAYLLWRARYAKVVCLARSVDKAKNSYLNAMALLVSFNCLLAVLLYRLGYAGEPNATLWHYGYMGVLALSPLAVAVSTRLAAPLSLSGRGCYFQRL